MQSIEKLSANLNPPQREAIDTLDGPLLILAGAGSGKTRVLTYRTANLIAQGEASPQDILAVTFTNKAAREMESRIVKLLASMDIPVFERMWISTFHSICARILRDHIHLLGYRPFFGIYDDKDQLNQIKKVLTAMNVSDKVHPPKNIQARINAAKMEALRPNQVANKKSFFMDKVSLEAYKRYEAEMQKANSLDFGDLLLKVHDLFQESPETLKVYREKFKYIMVDEYQDTNHIQYLIIQMLASQHRNLCVVGDEDQSIYSWRGADIGNILSFEKDFPECKVVKLEQNYRSTKNIIEAASRVIANNTERKDKKLFTENPDGEQISVREEVNEYQEARFVVGEIETHMNETDASLKDFAVFYRTNAQSRVLEDQLRSHGVPYKLVGSVKFYDRMEIKDILAYMKLLLNPTDDISFKRIVNVPARGIGKTTINKIEECAARENLPMPVACKSIIDEGAVNKGTANKLQAFLSLLGQLTVEADGAKPSEIYHLILDKTQYVQKLKDEDTSEADARIDNLESFDNAIVQFEKERGEEGTLQAFLEEIALVSDLDSMDDKENTVTLMTLHLSKGLEYPVVFVVGLEEGLFPSGRSIDSNDPSAVEEERRIAYVGMTRAEQKLYLTYAKSRRVWGSENFHNPSRFLQEIPEQFVSFSSGAISPRFVEKYRHNVIGQQNLGANGKSTGLPHEASDPMPSYEDFGNDEFESFEGNLDFKKGMRVRHPTFGVGSIFQTEGKGEDQKVSVVFSDKTVKKFVVKFARLERV